MIPRKYIKILLFIFLLVWMGILLAHPTNLTTADLGRHLKNGELVLNGQTEVLHQNLYSYTNPDYEFVNHHWGAGVIFFLIHSISGFKGLHLFYIFLLVLSFALVFDLARRFAGFKNAFLSSLFLIPLIASRTEIRPEVFTYLFVAVFFWITARYYRKELSLHWLILLPLLGILWVNTHIYFILAPLIILAFVFIDLVRKKITKRTKILAKTAGFTVLAFLVNPNFLQGLLYPFKIKTNYGYRIFENQSVWFLDSLDSLNMPSLDYFKIISVLFVLGLLLYLFRKGRNFPVLIIPGVFLILAWFMTRNVALFGILAVPALTIFLFSFFQYMKAKTNIDKLGQNLLGFILIIIFATAFLACGSFNFSGNLKLGTTPKAEASTKFFRSQHLEGPIFNNYDIGSFLIYHLFPEEKVFVDNRPETYPEQFFKEIYKPLQQNEDFWEKKSKEYNFNAIFFARHDYTPWAQEFLIKRVKDPEWVPVFVDNYSIIFLKKNRKNEKIISKYKLPKEMFVIKDSN